MANINHKPSKYMLNLLHVLPSVVEGKEDVINVIVENLQGTINKYEIITESGQLKLDRVGYSSLAFPFTYGALPQTWDYDGDPLDVEIVNVTEPLVPGCLVEARVIGVMKFEDGGEVDDKIIAVLADDRRSDHIQSIADFGEQFTKETTYFWERYKDLKKPGSGIPKGFFDKNEALKVIKECTARYDEEYAPKLEK
ncbi:MAG: inorganic diphosphatase [Candidatus Pacebacteria bacterium]|nr:inorganic diphosphatase [Candidatus Paceibacterota bacterium]